MRVSKGFGGVGLEALSKAKKETIYLVGESIGDQAVDGEVGKGIPTYMTVEKSNADCCIIFPSITL